jgi:hypothetical protein
MPEEPSAAEGKSDSFKVAVSVLIALTALTGALLSWAAARVGDRAGGQDGKAVQAALHRAQAEIMVASDAAFYRSAFESYRLHFLLSRVVRRQALAAPKLETAVVDEWERELRRAQAWRDQVDQDYLAGEGEGEAERERFDEARFRAAFLAEAAGQNALNPMPFVREAENGRVRVRRLVSLNLLLAAALFFLTLSLKTDGRGRRRWAAAGLTLFCAAAGLGLWRILG